MPDRYADIKNKLCELAEKDEDIRAVIAIGSYTRKDSPADQFSESCIGEGNGNPLQCSCLENPRDEGAWWAAVHGVAQSRT